MSQALRAGIVAVCVTGAVASWHFRMWGEFVVYVVATVVWGGDMVRRWRRP